LASAAVRCARKWLSTICIDLKDIANENAADAAFFLCVQNQNITSRKLRPVLLNAHHHFLNSMHFFERFFRHANIKCLVDR